MTSVTKRIVFAVSGSAPDGVDITYGSDSINDSPPGNGGTTISLPWSGHLRYNSNALYYDVTAQLQGGGHLNCGVYVEVINHYSDGTQAKAEKRIAHGSASGSFNICDAESS